MPFAFFATQASAFRRHFFQASSFWAALAVAGMLVGAAWRVIQYSRQASLYVDEAALALGIINHDITGLFGRLDYMQVAPAGFRLAVKTCAVVFGESEWSLRLFPFLCGLAALPVFYVVAGRLLPRPAAAVATVLFSLATPVAVYSTLLKPYSSDVLCALIVLAATHHMISSVGVRSRLVLVAGVGAAFFSQSALLVLAACGVVVLIDALLHRRPLRPRLIVLTVWAAAVLGNVWWNLSLMRAADTAYMLRFWEPFLMPAWSSAVQWLWLQFYRLIVDGPWPNGSLLYQMPKLWAALVAAGVIAAIRQGTSGLLLLAPAIAAVGVAAAGAYPLGNRTGLFLVPIVLLLVVSGARQLVAWAGTRAAAIAPMLLIPFAIVSASKFPPDFLPEHIRPSLQFMASHLQPDDRVWVYYGGTRAYEYYARRIAIPANPMFGICDRTDPSATLRQLEPLRGAHRAWIVITHATLDEQQLILARLDALGTRRDAHSASGRHRSVLHAAVYLYQLDGETGANAPGVESLHFADFEPAAWSCYGTMSRSPDGDQRSIEDLERQQ